MENKGLVRLVVLMFLCLFVAGWSSPGFTGDVARPDGSPGSAGLAALAPRTPEAFLRLVREWMDDPYMDGYGFAERLIGVEREQWVFDLKHNASDTEVYRYYVIDDRFIDKRHFGLGGIQITSTGHLWDIIIPFPDKNFCVSAEMVRRILGEPSSNDVRLPRKYSNKQPYKNPTIYYKYKTDKYDLDIEFRVKAYKRNEIISMSINEKRKLLNKISSFDFYKDICAHGMRFGTHEGRE